MSGSPVEETVASAIINRTKAVSNVRESQEAHRCNSLFDLETDKLLKGNQKQEEQPPAAEWKNSKYKICGNFVQDKKGDHKLLPKPSNLSNVVIGESQQPKQVQTPALALKRTSGSKLFHRRDTDQDLVVKKVENVEEVLPRKSPPPRLPPPPPLLQMSPGLPSMHHMRHPQPLMNGFPSNFSLEMAKRNSLLDFEKTMQYLHQTNNGNYANYQNMLNNQTIFNSFLSNSSGSFSNLLNFNHRRRKQSNTAGGSAENNFNIDHVREVEETEYANRMPPQAQMAHARAMNFKRPRDYQPVSSRSKKRGKWSESEDRVLHKLATTFLGRKEKINFKKISDHLAGRSAKQCREHWLSTLNPELKKGRWTKTEEMKLLELMISNGKSWSVIAKHITGRAEHSVKAKGRLMLGERLKSVSNSAVAYTGTEEQKRQLLDLHTHSGAEFDEISKQCGLIISPAKIERILLSICSCPNCTAMNDQVKATKMNNFLQGWTMVKSRHIKASMMRKSSKYYQQQLLAQQQAEGMKRIETGYRASPADALVKAEETEAVVPAALY